MIPLYLTNASSDEYLPVATTRPETILGDTAVAVHPEDDRFKHLIGKECEVPLCDGRRVPIIASTMVEREFGTGALKITPGHDPTDYQIGQTAGLEIINIMTDQVTLNENAGAYAGLGREEARVRIWEGMKAAGLDLKEEPHTMRVPRSQRGGDIVEPLVREQWFVRAEPLAGPALQAVDDGRLRIMPERFERTYRQWLDNIRDWCISRQLWWGHRIPVWYVFSSEAEAEASRDGRGDKYVVARSEEEASKLAQERHGDGVVLRQESDVLDTWFSSGLWPFSTVGWPDESAPDYKTFYPGSIMETGHDILFFWVARMVMMGINLTGQVPFHTVYLHGLVKDEKGRKMSKSLGNVVDPLDVIGTYSCDALRFTLATGTSPGQDLNLSIDRVTSTHAFVNKLWNAGKFILLNLEKVQEGSDEWQNLQNCSFSSSDALDGLALTERWVLSALHQVTDDCTAALERLDFSAAGRQTYDFFWNQFADWYVEAAKTRLYSSDPDAAEAARKVLVYSFRVILALLHPLVPFVSERLWRAIPHTGPTLIVGPWPSHEGAIDSFALTSFQALQGIVRSIRNARAEYGVDLGRRIPATILVADSQLRDALQQEATVLASLAKIDHTQLNFKAADATREPAQKQEAGLITLVIAEGLQVELPMAGLFDADKEAARLRKQREKLAGELKGLDGRLSNDSFVSKAPENVVAEARGKRDEAARQLSLVEDRLKQMENLAGELAGAR
ncbi:hypothetical protein WJX73_003862 [Symbiochloris irregularis]|uniref:valine--tRNA ligase n=1 Tax=Symbiochloris irregularis TaxID=706552 RepID=A0AAW1Q2H8_9CHLO